MRLQCSLVVAACGAALACSGTVEPGALTIVLDATPPELTNAGTVQLAGQVTRTPAEEGVRFAVTVTHAGGSQTDSTDASNRFAFTVTLAQNTENPIQLSAADASGSTGTPVTVTVVHDGVGPAVTSISPAAQTDGVTANVVTATLSEPLHATAGAGIGVVRQGAQVAGTVTLSADSLILTFTPDAPFATNAIHTIVIGGLEDALGNQGGQASACFVTAGAGQTFPDPTDDIWVGGGPTAELVPPDLLELRLARSGGELRSILRFTTPRTLNFASPNNLLAAIDFDTDEDGATGFITVKDFVFEGVLPASGAAAESAIWLLSDPANSVQPAVLQYTADLQGTVTHTFTPDFCGTFIGFGVPEAAPGIQSGAFRVVAYAEAADNQGFYADPAPENGFHAVVLAAPAGVATFDLFPRVQGGAVGGTLLSPFRRLPASLRRVR